MDDQTLEILKQLQSLESKLETQMNSNRDTILGKFEDYKDHVCTPTRIKFEKEIEGIKVKQGLLSGFFGTAGGALALAIKYFIKK